MIIANYSVLDAELKAHIHDFASNSTILELSDLKD